MHAVMDNTVEIQVEVVYKENSVKDFAPLKLLRKGNLNGCNTYR